MKLTVRKLNEVYLKVMSDDRGVLQELSDYFMYEIPGGKYSPKFKAGLWDAKIRLFRLNTQTLYVGLYDALLKFGERNDIEIETVGDINKSEGLNKAAIEEWMNELNIHSKGKKLSYYPHQIDATFEALNEKRATILSPTSSGKSGIIYAMIRWHLMNKRKVLLIVPTTQLCEQMWSDMSDYSSESEWDINRYCQMLYSGHSKEQSAPVMISTWQSIHSILKGSVTKDYVKGYDVVIVDEGHLAKGESITGLLETMVNTEYRVALTGTLDGMKANVLTITGCFGPVKQFITTRELMDDGKVVDLDIRGIVLKHPDEDCKLVKGADFQQEMDFLTEHPRRNKFIANLAINTTGTTIVLVTKIDKHLIPLYELIKEKAGDRKVYKIHGDVKAADREAIRLELDRHPGSIIVASFATCATGINIPSIENIILASSSKSKIRNLQSIGRGLRLKEGKTKCKLFDIADDLTYKKKENTVYKHFKERIDIYSKEQFTYKIIEVLL